MSFKPKKMYKEFRNELMKNLLRKQTSQQHHTRPCVYCNGKKRKCEYCKGRGWYRI